MTENDIKPGDIVYAKENIYSDGSLPEYPENALIAAAGTRGVLINVGEIIIEETKETGTLLLARFEDEGQVLGLAVGCWPEELMSLTEWETQIHKKPIL